MADNHTEKVVHDPRQGQAISVLVSLQEGTVVAAEPAQTVQAVTLADGSKAFIQHPKNAKFLEGQTVTLEDGSTAVVQVVTEKVGTIDPGTGDKLEGQPINLEDGTTAYLQQTAKAVMAEGLQAITLEDGRTEYIAHPNQEGLFGEAATLDGTTPILERLSQDVFSLSLDEYNRLHNTSISSFKPLQEETLKCVVQGDTLAILPTGYGKSLIYEILPILHAKYHQQKPAFIIVIVPLNVIVEQEVKKLGERSLNLTNAVLCDLKPGSIEGVKLLSGHYTYMFSHPENITDQKCINDILLHQHFQEDVDNFIIIDEAHNALRQDVICLTWTSTVMMLPLCNVIEKTDYSVMTCPSRAMSDKAIGYSVVSMSDGLATVSLDRSGYVAGNNVLTFYEMLNYEAARKPTFILFLCVMKAACMHVMHATYCTQLHRYTCRCTFPCYSRFSNFLQNENQYLLFTSLFSKLMLKHVNTIQAYTIYIDIIILYQIRSY